MTGAVAASRMEGAGLEQEIDALDGILRTSLSRSVVVVRGGLAWWSAAAASTEYGSSGNA